jgi:hypothetical protein
MCKGILSFFSFPIFIFHFFVHLLQAYEPHVHALREAIGLVKDERSTAAHASRKVPEDNEKKYKPVAQTWKQ